MSGTGKPRQPKTTPALREEIKRLKLSGATVPALAKEFGLSVTTVNNVIYGYYDQAPSGHRAVKG